MDPYKRLFGWQTGAFMEFTGSVIKNPYFDGVPKCCRNGIIEPLKQ